MKINLQEEDANLSSIVAHGEDKSLLGVETDDKVVGEEVDARRYGG